MKARRAAAAVFLLLVCLPDLSARDIKVTGKVTCAGRGVPDVWVTDGANFVRTGLKGEYELVADDRNPFVYLTVPSGYEVPVEQGVSRFYQRMPSGRKGRCDFQLQRRKQDERKQCLIVTADPQIACEKEFPKLREGVADIRETVAEHPDAFAHGICAGDLTFNRYDLLDRYNAVMAASGILFRNVAGNHDHTDYKASNEDSFDEYEKVYGPAWYSYDIGDIHYVMLDDNFFLGREWYYIGYLDKRQLAWLEQDLSHVEPGSTVFASMHIPSTEGPGDRKVLNYPKGVGVLTNFRTLFDLLKPFNAHLLHGHTHTTYNEKIGDSLYVHVVPSIGGAWWQGPVCTDGTPLGYRVFEIDGPRVENVYFKSVGFPRDYQCRLFTGADAPEYAGYAVANVWGEDADWTVEFRFDGVPADTVERIVSRDPAARLYYQDKSKLDYEWIGPTDSRHFFRAALPAGTREVEVVVTDRFGTTFRASKTLVSKPVVCRIEGSANFAR